MMRGIEEWNRHPTGTGEWSFRRNADAIKAYWRAGAQRMRDAQTRKLEIENETLLWVYGLQSQDAAAQAVRANLETAPVGGERVGPRLPEARGRGRVR